MYAWYFKDTGEIFHIGKGKGNRYKDTKSHRNEYFKNVIRKHNDNVDVKFLFENMTEQEALDKEREQIAYYKSIGQCKTNLHEGGCGGYTGNYYSPERIRKLREYGKTRVGSLNPNYGHHMSEDNKRKLSIANKGKKLSPAHIEKLRIASTGRKKTPEEIEKTRQANLGKVIPKEVSDMIAKEVIKDVYIVEYDGIQLSLCFGYRGLAKFCDKYLFLSRTITVRIIEDTYAPKFNRHMWTKKLKIMKTEKNEEYSKILDEIYPNSNFKITNENELMKLNITIKNMFLESKKSRYGKNFMKHSKNQDKMLPADGIIST